MSKYQQGDIVFVDLNPTRGVETNKKRPCVIVSNNHYNRLMNTLLIAPISSSPKYHLEEKYQVSPFYVSLPYNPKIKRTILLQHFRSIDQNARINTVIVMNLDAVTIRHIRQVISQFF